VQFRAKFRFETWPNGLAFAILRPSHDTREQTVAELRRGYLAGRLDTDTFSRRVGDAMRSGSHDELRGLTADLPASPPAGLTQRLRARLGQRPAGLLEAGDLVHAQLTIGRSSSCQLVLSDDTVSRRHAELFLDGGRWILRDLGSSNGTWVNGRRVVEAEVRTGDVVHFGGCRLRL
jgi:FHA domain/Domain of unknown function (DUF1707)